MPATSNLLLDSLSLPLLAEVLRYTQPLPLPVRYSLYAADQSPLFGYFLTSGIASVVTSSTKGGTVEVEVVGCEGVVGAMHLLGTAVAPTQCFMQLPGSGFRIKLSVLREIFQVSAELRGRMLEFVQVQALTLGQIAGCHRLHSAEQRLARWLLMVQDRVASDDLPLTQEFLAEMLGSQRTTVSAVAAEMQKAGIIEYTRGHLRVLNRKALEAVACDCYAVTHRLLQTLYT